jgi:hypothetical protein
MSAHTPGPWVIGKETYFHAVRSDGGKTTRSTPLLPIKEAGDDFPREVALVWHNLKGQGESAAIDIANARLIAAAPELLAVVKKLRHAINVLGLDPVDENYTSIVEQADMAIAKAEGR